MSRQPSCRRPRYRSFLWGLALLGATRLVSAAPPASGRASNASSPSSAAAGEASDHFKRGLQLFDEGDYALALVEFDRAYQLAPNYRALYNIALVHVQLGRYADAARTFEQYLRDGDSAIAEARRAEVDRTLGQLKLRTATITILTNTSSAEILLDGRPVDPARLRAAMLIDAGEHVIKAQASGYTSRERTVTLAGGDRAAIRFDLAAAAAPPPPHHAAGPGADGSSSHRIFWPGFVATGALAIGTVVGGAVMFNAKSDLQSLQDTPGSDAGQRQSAADRANTAALATDILAGLTLVAGAASVYFSLTSDRSPRAPTVALTPQRISLSAAF